MHDTVIRRARASDADAIAAVHVAAWREAYAGLLPDRLLRSLSVAEGVEKWRANLGGAATTVLVAERADGALAGFGSCGPQRATKLEQAGYAGEIEAIYLLAAEQGRGLGRRMMAEMARDLIARDLRGASLWVLRDNRRARGFYQALGGGLIDRHTAMRGHIAFHEVAYGWPDVSDLIHA